MIEAFLTGLLVAYLIDIGWGWFVLWLVLVIVVGGVWLLIVIAGSTGYDPDRNRGRRSDD